MTKQGEGPGNSQEAEGEGSLGQIEYLLYQSTQGIHFIFDHSRLAEILKRPTDEASFFTDETKSKVQELLTAFLGQPTIEEKRSYLDGLAKDEFEILVRAYFQLVENTILAHSSVRH